MAQLKSTIITGSLSVTNSVLAERLAVINGTANQILMADGSLKDSSEISGTTYTFKSGTGGFTVTPSGGSGQFVSTASDLSGYVTLATDQTITGAKTFSKDTIFESKITAKSILKDGGTATQFLMADGSTKETSTLPIPTDYYWANVKISDSASTVTEPIVKSIKANYFVGNTDYTTNLNVDHYNNVNPSFRLDTSYGQSIENGYPGSDGRILTFFWRNERAYDTQIHIPDDANNHLKVRTKGDSSWTKNWKEIAYTNDIGNGTITIKQTGRNDQTFTVNQSGNTTINLDNNTYDLSGYATKTWVEDEAIAFATAQSKLKQTGTFIRASYNQDVKPLEDSLWNNGKYVSALRFCDPSLIKIYESIDGSANSWTLMNVNDETKRDITADLGNTTDGLRLDTNKYYRIDIDVYKANINTYNLITINTANYKNMQNVTFKFTQYNKGNQVTLAESTFTSLGTWDNAYLIADPGKAIICRPEEEANTDSYFGHIELFIHPTTKDGSTQKFYIRNIGLISHNTVRPKYPFTWSNKGDLLSINETVSLGNTAHPWKTVYANKYVRQDVTDQPENKILMANGDLTSVLAKNKTGSKDYAVTRDSDNSLYVHVPWEDHIVTDTNTWRPIQLNGVEKLNGTDINGSPLNIKSGSNMTITENGGTFTFTATDKDTTYTFAGGKDSFTVTPKGGTAQIVPVTHDDPDLTGYVTLTTDQIITGQKTFNKPINLTSKTSLQYNEVDECIEFIFN